MSKRRGRTDRRTCSSASTSAGAVIGDRALIDWLVWNHAPTVAMLLAMALVVGGGLVALRVRVDTPPTGGLSTRGL